MRMSGNKGLAYCLVVLVLTFALPCFAKDINFEISTDRSKVGLGQSLQLNFIFNGTQSMPALELPAIEGFQSHYVGPSTSISVINGRMSSSITHIYTLLPTKVGEFKIGPFKFEHEGDTYNSNSIQVQVVEASSQADNQPSQEGQIDAKDLSERIFLVMEVKKNKLYTNEIVPVAIKLFVNRLGVRDIQFPQISHDGFSIGEFEQPKQYQQEIGGINYNVVEFNTTIFGLRPGEFRFGPASLSCNLIAKKQNRRAANPSFDDFFNSDVFDDFFGGYEAYPYSLKSTDISVTVLPLPEENKPQGFSGALGVFDFEVQVSPTEVKAGDPITLKAAVRGSGNFNTVNIAKVASDNNFKTYEPSVKQEKEAKTFEQVLIPLSSQVKEIPAMIFGYFNTDTGKYETITKGPFPIKVTQPENIQEPKLIESKQLGSSYQKEEKLGRDIIYIKDNIGKLGKKGDYLYKNKLFLGFQLIPLLSYLLTLLVYRRNRKLKTDIKYARQLLAPRRARVGISKAKGYMDKGMTQEFYDAIFDTLQGYLGDKFHLSSKGITISIIDEQIKDIGVSEETLAKLRDIFKECDMVRYAASAFTRENMQNSLNKLQEIIDYFQRHKA